MQRLSIKRLRQALGALLTFAALAAGQTAAAVSKTVTYTFTAERVGASNSYKLTFTPAGDQFGTSAGTKTVTISNVTNTTGFYVQLDDGVQLRFIKSAGQMTFGGFHSIFLSPADNPRFEVVCYDYYIRHVTLANKDGNALNGTSTEPVYYSGVLDVDVDIDKSDDTTNNAFYVSSISGSTTFCSITLTLADHPSTAPVTISGLTYNGAEGYYEIATADDLRALAAYVNDGNTCEGLTFEQTADIAFSYNTAWNDDASTEHNFDGIGYNYGGIAGNNIIIIMDIRDFSGTFDGNGHTISGIRFYRTRSANTVIDGAGLFGCIGESASSTVKNVCLADTRITGTNAVGGIVGRCGKHGAVSGCTVGSNATICGFGVDDDHKSAENIGGIVGFNDYGTVTGCTSSAILTATDVNYADIYGGIVGNNTGSITDCHAYGVVLPNVPTAGAIAGKSSLSATLSDNTYHSCIWGNYAFNIGVAQYYMASTYYKSGDYGCTFEKRLWLFDDRDNTALIEAYSKVSNSDASTAHGATRPTISSLPITLKGRTLYKDGKWNTLCLPFYANITGYYDVLKGATIMELDKATENASGHVTGFDEASGTLTLNFKTATSIDRTKPYIIKWDSGADLVEPTFRDVGPNNLRTNYTTVTSNDRSVTFLGSYKPVALNSGDNTKIVFGRSNTVGFPTEDGVLNAFSSYFTVNNGAEVRDIVLNFGDGTNTISVTAHEAIYAGQTRYWATFYHPTYNYRLPAGAQAFTLKSDKTLYRVGDGSVIPAGCAVVIMADAADLTLTLTGNGATLEDGNILQGTSSAGAVAGARVLSKVGDDFGFFTFTGTIPANKAYYVE